jgi:hypothetical protein
MEPGLVLFRKAPRGHIDVHEFLHGDHVVLADGSQGNLFVWLGLTHQLLSDLLH